MRLAATLAACTLVAISTAHAASPKTYQVTGPVVEVRDDAIVVQKGSEKWEIARDRDTKVTGDLKQGAKVTVKYTMKATSIDSKGEGAAGKKK